MASSVDATAGFEAKSRSGAGSAGTLPFAIAFAVLFYLSFAPALFNDGDTSWHLAAGKLMLERGVVPNTDPFSFTFAGQPWTAHEWLSEAIMAGAFAAGSWSALSLLFATSVAGLILMIGLEAGRRLARLPLAALMLGVFMVLTPFILARPHVLVWPILAGWTILLMRARDVGRAPPLAAALLMTLWANMHGSFVFGLLLAGAFALEALIDEQDRKSVLIRWGAFGLASLVASLATPHGFHGLLFPLQLSGMESLPLISEWRATVLVEEPAFLLVLLGTLLSALYLGVKVPPVRLIILAAMLFLAFAHVRHQAVLAIVGALLLAEPFSRASGGSMIRQRVSKAMGAAAIAATLLLWTVRPLVPTARADTASNPLTAIAHVPHALRRQPVLNSYGFGGPLILAGIQPFIDGRADMYGDAFMFRHQDIVEGDLGAFRKAVGQWGIKWTILAPDDALVRLLDNQPGWRRIYEDDWAVVHMAAQPD